MHKRAARSRSRFETSFEWRQTGGNGLLEPLLTQGRGEGMRRGKELIPRLLDELGRDYSAVVELLVEVTALAMSDFGVIVGTADGSVFRIAFDMGKVEMGKHKERVECAGVREKWAITGAKDGSLVRWDIVEVQEEIRFEGHSAAVVCVALSENYVASGSSDASLCLHKWDSPGALTIFLGHTGAITRCQITIDELCLVSASYDHTIRLWSLTDYQSLGVLTGHTDTVYSFVITRDCTRVVSSSFDHTIKVWGLQTKEEIGACIGHTAWIRCVILTPDESHIISGSDDLSIRIWSMSDYGLISVMTGHTHWVMSLTLTPDSKYIVSTSLDQTVRVWSFFDSWEVATFEGHSQAVKFVAITQDSRVAVSGGCDGSVRMWSLDEQGDVAKLVGHEKRVKCVGVTLDGSIVISGAEDETIRVWSVEDLTETSRLTGHLKFINCLAITPDNSTLITGSEDSTIRLWSLSTLLEISVFEGHTSWINCLAISKDGSILVSGSGDNTVRVWEFQTGKCLSVLIDHSHWVKAVAITPNRQFIISGSYDNTIKIWSIADSYRCVDTLKGHARSVTSLCVSADGLKLISGSLDSTIRVWNLEQGKETGQLIGHGDSVLTLALTLDDKYVISGSADKSIRVWSLTDMQQLAQFDVHSDAVSTIALSPDGKRIIAGSRDCSVSIFDFRNEISAYRRQFLLDFNTGKDLHAAFENKQPSTLFRGNVRRLRETGEINPTMASYLVSPYLFNSLHVCAYFNHYRPMSKYLSANVLFVRGAFGSPLTVALKRSTRKCIETVLLHFVSITDDSHRWTFAQELTDDLPELLVSKSPSLVLFLSALFLSKRQPGLPHFILPLENLPMTKYSESYFVHEKAFAQVEGSGRNEKLMERDSEIVEFQESLFAWNFTAGSTQSLTLLRALEDCEIPKVLTTNFVTTLIDHKWRTLWPLTFALTLLYTLLLFLLVGLHFGYLGPTWSCWTFIGINVFFLLYECLQATANGLSYFTDPWNYLDIVRGVVAILWGYIFIQQEDRWQSIDVFVMVLCFLRGFTFFRTFKMTRMFVRMILEVVKEMYSFLIILMYSTFSFAMIYSVLNPHRNETLLQAWRTAYEVNMGEFSNEGFDVAQWACFMATSLLNIVIMLNLLISILGDAFERAQISSKSHDTLEMLRLIIEYESLLFWRRFAGRPFYLVKCKLMNEETAKEEWEGRTNTVIGSVRGQIGELEGRLVGKEKSELQEVERRIMAGVEAKISNLDRKITDKFENIARKLEEIQNLRTHEDEYYRKFAQHSD